MGKNLRSNNSEELHRSSPPNVSAKKHVVIKWTVLPIGYIKTWEFGSE